MSELEEQQRCQRLTQWDWKLMTKYGNEFQIRHRLIFGQISVVFTSVIGCCGAHVTKDLWSFLSFLFFIFVHLRVLFVAFRRMRFCKNTGSGVFGNIFAETSCITLIGLSVALFYTRVHYISYTIRVTWSLYPDFGKVPLNSTGFA